MVNKKEKLIILINILITTILFLTSGIPTNMEMISYYWWNHVVFIIYLIALYIVICKINKQQIKWKGFILVIIFWIVKYGSDYLLTKNQKEIPYGANITLDLVKGYSYMNDIIIKESFFKVIIQLGIIAIFISILYMLGNVQKRRLQMNIKYIVLLIILLIIYVVIVYYKYYTRESINIGQVYINPINKVNSIFYYAESSILWLYINDRFSVG